MKKDKTKITGTVIARVIDPKSGEVKKESVHHNIVTNEGDALIADAMADSQARTRVDNANGVIGVGTGYSSAGKTTDALVTQTGPFEPMDSGYPQVKGTFAATDDNVVQYRATWEPGDLNDTGIDEAIIKNGSSGDTLAYAQISPAVDVTSTDILQVTWELTFTGS